MGKSKSKSKGKKGKKGSKGKKGKKSKKEKKVKEEEPLPPPDLNTFVYIRHKNITLCLETHEEETVKELKIQVATILRQFSEDIALFAMLGKQEEIMEEKEKPKKDDDKKKQDRSSSRGRSGPGGKGRDKSKERSPSPPKPPGDMTLGGYGYNPTTASIFKPGTIGLSYRGDDGEFEKLEILPFSEFPVIPEAIKMTLRNYVPPPPPPPKRSGSNNPQKGRK